MNLLFICSRNRLRSPTAEAIFAKYTNTRSAGTALDAEYRVGFDDLEWADIVFVMEKRHAKQLRELFPKLEPRVICLDIPDQYEYMQPELMALLEQKILPFLN
jgi:predicted protein tyrosine phosphatase